MVCALTLALLTGANRNQSRHRKQSLECAFTAVLPKGGTCHDCGVVHQTAHPCYRKQP